MSCGSTKFTEGETIKGSVIEDSHVRDSVLNRVEILSPNLQGPVTLDDEAIASLTAVLLAALQGQPVEVDLARLAATFTNCQGLPLIPGVKIATCQDLADALAASCCGQGGAGDTISGVTFDPVTRTLTIVTSSQTWTVTVPEGDAIVDVTFDPATRDLTVTSTSQEWVVNIPGGDGGGDTVTDLNFDPDARELALTVVREDGTQEELTTEIPAESLMETCYIHCYDEGEVFSAGQLVRVEDRVYYCLQDNGPGTALGVVNPEEKQPEVVGAAGESTFLVWSDQGLVSFETFGASAQAMRVEWTTGRVVAVDYNAGVAEVRVYDNYAEDAAPVLVTPLDETMMLRVEVDWASHRIIIIGQSGKLWTNTDYLNPDTWRVEVLTTNSLGRAIVDWGSSRCAVVSQEQEIFFKENVFGAPGGWQVSTLPTTYQITDITVDWTTGEALIMDSWQKLWATAQIGAGDWEMRNAMLAAAYPARFSADWARDRVLIIGMNLRPHYSEDRGKTWETFKINSQARKIIDWVVEWTADGPKQGLLATTQGLYYMPDVLSTDWDMVLPKDVSFLQVSADWTGVRGLVLASGKFFATGAGTRIVWNEAYKRYDSAPVGTLSSFVGNYIPRDYLPADGSTILRADYPALTDWALLSGNAVPQDEWDAMSYMFGLGDGSTTLTLPYQPAMLGNTLYGIKAR